MVVTSCREGQVVLAEARDAADHSTMHRTVPKTKNYPPSEVTSAEAEYPVREAAAEG